MKTARGRYFEGSLLNACHVILSGSQNAATLNAVQVQEIGLLAIWISTCEGRNAKSSKAVGLMERRLSWLIH